MAKGSPNLRDAPQDTGNLEPEDLATNQEAVAVPLGAGEFKVAVKWISPIYNQFTREAPTERPGKK